MLRAALRRSPPCRRCSCRVLFAGDLAETFSRIVSPFLALLLEVEGLLNVFYCVAVLSGILEDVDATGHDGFSFTRLAQSNFGHTTEINSLFKTQDPELHDV